MNFSAALEHIKTGHLVARDGWNGRGMFIFLVSGSTFEVNRAPLMGIYAPGTVIDYHAHIDMRTADGQVVPWQPSQTDMLADDWVVVTKPAYMENAEVAQQVRAAEGTLRHARPEINIDLDQKG